MVNRCLILLTFLTIHLYAAAQIPELHSAYVSAEPAGSSVLATGKWYKIKIKSTGIYRLTYEDLVSMGFSDPGNISVFGNGGRMLPLMNNVARYDDLIERPVYMSKGADGIFNQGDYLLFYGEGPVTWNYYPDAGMFLHKVHEYSNATYYFITDGGQKLRITERPQLTGSHTAESVNFVDYNYYDKPRFNVLESGRQWFSNRLNIKPFDTTFSFPGILTSSTVRVKVGVAGRSEVKRTFPLKQNNSTIGTLTTNPIILTNKTGAYADGAEGYFSFVPAGDKVNLNLTFTRAGASDEGYLDYITLNARRRLSFTGDFMFFRDTTRLGSTSVVRYTIENCTSQTEIWDITNPFQIVKVPAVLNGSSLRFTDSTRSLHEYVVLNTGAVFPKPLFNSDEPDLGIVPSQNLHGLGSYDMLIITHPDFIAAADSIAEFHMTKDGLTVYTATTDQVYNEFSSGARDVSAIRDFAKMMYDRGGANKLKYLLLVGDGSYYNLSSNNKISGYIPTYQSEQSLNAASSYVSDDFFGYMEFHEGGSNFMETYTMDIGVGRLPVKTAGEALDIYRKIKNYNRAENKGDWQNNILFAGDDQDGNLHMNQANQLATWVESTHPDYAVKKVFLDAYPQVSSSTGTRYPDANRIIRNNFEKGLLIFNYTGHGGELGLADEQILMREDLSALKNFNNLPLFITATCEFSRFDDLAHTENGELTESTSAGEYSILNPNGGSIALVSTTRVVWSGENHQLNTRLLQIALNRDENGNYRTLGEIVRLTKNALGSSKNKLNFILLGDPALKLAIPSYKVVTDSVNSYPADQKTDTLKAFSKVVITGHIEDQEQNMLTTYNGILIPSVYDKQKTVTTLANDIGALPMQFTVTEDLLFKGRTSIKNGKFRFEFNIPKDITYNYGNGKISYYSTNNESDAKGSFSGFVIGGTNEQAQPDNEGPVITLYLNDQYFNDKGITSQNPVIYAEISDESGINTIGNGIGHDIIGIIDDDRTNPVVMNDFFESSLDDNTSGTLIYPMFALSEGMHSLRVKVWDIYNNSSEAVIEFRVISDNRIVITRVGNYPNPASDHTSFVFEHNQAGKELNATITIFDMSGRIIYTYNETISAGGFNSVLPQWDLRDMYGNPLMPGIYPYQIRITDGEGSYAEGYQKLVVVR